MNSRTTSRTHKKKTKKIPTNIRERCLSSFQRLRRLEEADTNGNVRCISCGRILHWKDAQGGHYVSRQNRAVELERDNVWPQCPVCNGILSGNIVSYRINLVKKIGEERVKRIEDMAMAYKGSEEASEKLSMRDRIAVIQKRSKQYYASKKEEFDSRLKDLGGC